MRLAGRVATITGAAGGFGRAIALRFAEEGADVAVADINEKGLQETARLVRERGREPLALPCDVTQRADVQRLVDETVARFGRLTTMVANAGVVELVPFLDMTDQEWSRTQAVNLTGVFLCDQIAGRQLARQGEGGQIINLSSQLAEVGAAMAASYCASKAAVKSLTKSVALALAEYGIRVNAIGPGPIETDLTSGMFVEPEVLDHFRRHVPLGYLGDPIDVAHVALFLASDETKWMTGETIFPDGGYLLGGFDSGPEYPAALLRASTRLRRP